MNSCTNSHFVRRPYSRRNCSSPPIVLSSLDKSRAQIRQYLRSGRRRSGKKIADAFLRRSNRDSLCSRDCRPRLVDGARIRRSICRECDRDLTSNLASVIAILRAPFYDLRRSTTRSSSPRRARATLRIVLRPQVQEPDTLRSALCRRGADGVLGLHAAVAQLQTTKFRLRSCTKEVLDHLDLPAATSSVLR